MTIEKEDPTFFDRFVVPLLGYFFISPLLGCLIIFAVIPKDEQLGIVLFCVLIVVMVTGLAVLHNRLLGHYRCPQCDKELPRYRESHAREYRFYCKSCDILWKTGLKEGEYD